MERLPLVLPGAIRQQWTRATHGCRGDSKLCEARLQRPAAPLHALLPALQAKNEASMVPQRVEGSLSALPVADFARVHAILPVVRPQ